MLCRQVLKVVVRKVVVGKTVVSWKKLLCCSLFLRWHLRATIQFESYLFVQRDATQSAVLPWEVAGAPARGGQGGQAPTLEKIEWAMPTLEILTVV